MANIARLSESNEMTRYTDVLAIGKGLNKTQPFVEHAFNKFIEHHPNYKEMTEDELKKVFVKPLSTIVINLLELKTFRDESKMGVQLFTVYGSMIKGDLDEALKKLASENPKRQGLRSVDLRYLTIVYDSRNTRMYFCLPRSIYKPAVKSVKEDTSNTPHQYAWADMIVLDHVSIIKAVLSLTITLEQANEAISGEKKGKKLGGRARFTKYSADFINDFKLNAKIPTLFQVADNIMYPISDFTWLFPEIFGAITVSETDYFANASTSIKKASGGPSRSSASTSHADDNDEDEEDEEEKYESSLPTTTDEFSASGSQQSRKHDRPVDVVTSAKRACVPPSCRVIGNNRIKVDELPEYVSDDDNVNNDDNDDSVDDDSAESKAVTDGRKVAASLFERVTDLNIMRQHLGNHFTDETLAMVAEASMEGVNPEWYKSTDFVTQKGGNSRAQQIKTALDSIAKGKRLDVKTWGMLMAANLDDESPLMKHMDAGIFGINPKSSPQAISTLMPQSSNEIPSSNPGWYAYLMMATAHGATDAMKILSEAFAGEFEKLSEAFTAISEENAAFAKIKDKMASVEKKNAAERKKEQAEFEKREKKLLDRLNAMEQEKKEQAARVAALEKHVKDSDARVSELQKAIEEKGTEAEEISEQLRNAVEEKAAVEKKLNDNKNKIHGLKETIKNNNAFNATSTLSSTNDDEYVDEL